MTRQTDTTQFEVSLLHTISQHFDEEELRTLCFKLEGIDYDDLTAKGKVNKARELVMWMKRRGRLEELADAIRQERPHLALFEPQRIQELQTEISGGLQPELQPAFQEFMTQVDAHQTLLAQLYRELEEWKELHYLLQALQTRFAPCHDYVARLNRIRNSWVWIQRRQQKKLVHNAETDWRPCRRELNRIKGLAASVQWIDDPYNPKTGEGPAWFLELLEPSVKIKTCFSQADFVNLPEWLSAFGDVVDQWLYQADKSLREVVQQTGKFLQPGPLLE